MGEKKQSEKNPQLNSDQSHDNQKVDENLQLNPKEIQIEIDVQENPQLNSDQSQDKLEDPFRSDLRLINKLVKAEQKRRIAEQKTARKNG